MSEPVYEMVWDCGYCGAQKLLGLTHRHCPNCGAAQDPNARYFPADSERVAVRDHTFVGADVKCRYCAAASSKRAQHCGNCGAPLAEGAQVQQQPDTSAAISLSSTRPTTPPPWPAWKIVLPITALLLVGVTVVLLVWKKDQRLTVAAHTWRRSVTVERFGPVAESAWCDELPSGANDVTRRREQRGTKQVPDGEDCRARKKDRGDGTYAEERECTPRFKQEPVYEEKCAFTIVKWKRARQEVAEGTQGAPRWPAVTLARAGCNSPGCEREAGRDETYTVVFRDAAGEEYRCNFDEKSWARYADGDRYSGKLRAVVGSLDCSTLHPAR
jgi:hypothetical protein